MLRELKWGPGVPVTRELAKDIFRVSNTSRFLLSLGKETSGILPRSWDMFAVTFIDHIYLERKKRKAVVLQLPVKFIAGIPWKIHCLCLLKNESCWCGNHHLGKKGSTWMLSKVRHRRTSLRTVKRHQTKPLDTRMQQVQGRFFWTSLSQLEKLS